MRLSLIIGMGFCLIGSLFLTHVIVSKIGGLIEFFINIIDRIRAFCNHIRAYGYEQIYLIPAAIFILIGAVLILYY